MHRTPGVLLVVLLAQVLWSEASIREQRPGRTIEVRLSARTNCGGNIVRYPFLRDSCSRVTTTNIKCMQLRGDCVHLCVDEFCEDCDVFEAHQTSLDGTRFRNNVKSIKGCGISLGD